MNNKELIKMATIKTNTMKALERDIKEMDLGYLEEFMINEVTEAAESELEGHTVYEVEYTIYDEDYNEESDSIWVEATTDAKASRFVINEIKEIFKAQ